MDSRMLVLMLVLAIPGACGGNVAETESEEEEQEETTTAEATETPAGGDQDGGSTFTDSRQLGECVPGFDPFEEPETPCTWLGDDGLCYDTRDAACDCVCPHDANSTCASGFPGGVGSRTEVYCT